MSHPEPCAGCGEPSLDVTAIGDRMRTHLTGCRCPRPCCFLCLKPLDDDGRCVTTFCPMDGLLVPIPELA